MNSFGTVFKITTWGESHGYAMGVIIDGCPAGLTINENEITQYLRKNDRPIPEIATGRIEPNNVEILSGVDDNKTIGTPISILIKNEDYKKKDYKNINKIFRPGHGDYTFYAKYRSPYQSGGGRASGRECITRLAAGYIAEKLIRQYCRKFKIKTKLTSMAGISIFDNKSLKKAINKVKQIAENGDSSGGELEIKIRGLPPGIGEPVFDGVDAKIASALMGIGAVKSVEFGLGKIAACARGSEYNDDFCLIGNKISFVTNHNGGVLSGISNGDDLIVSVAVKPTPSILKTKTGITADKQVKDVSVAGRHDKNITPRIAPIARAMISLVLADYLLLSGRIKRDFIIKKEKSYENLSVSIG